MNLLKTISELPEENQNALEKILNNKIIGNGNFSLQDILEMIDAYIIYDGNALQASKEVQRSHKTLIKYWKWAEFKIGGKGRKPGSLDLIKYNIKELIEKRLSRSEIANKIGISYSSFETYLINHPELPPVIDERKGIKDSDMYKKYKLLIRRGLNQNKIAGILEVKRQAVNDYLRRHSELRQIYQNIRRIKNERLFLVIF